jgi:hypothetical protein
MWQHFKETESSEIVCIIKVIRRKLPIDYISSLHATILQKHEAFLILPRVTLLISVPFNPQAATACSAGPFYLHGMLHTIHTLLWHSTTADMLSRRVPRAGA